MICFRIKNRKNIKFSFSVFNLKYNQRWSCFFKLNIHISLWFVWSLEVSRPTASHSVYLTSWVVTSWFKPGKETMRIDCTPTSWMPWKTFKRGIKELLVMLMFHWKRALLNYWETWQCFSLFNDCVACPFVTRLCDIIRDSEVCFVIWH